MKRKSAKVDVSGVMLTPRSAQKVNYITRPRGQGVYVYFKTGVAVVMRQEKNADGTPRLEQYSRKPMMSEWRRPGLDVGPVREVAHMVMVSRRSCSNALYVKRPRRTDGGGTRLPTDAEVENAIVMANLTLCFCVSCRERIERDSEVASDIVVPLSYPTGGLLMITAASYTLRYHVALANGLVQPDVLDADGDPVPQTAGSIDPDLQGKIDALLAEAARPVPPEVAPDPIAATPIPVEESEPEPAPVAIPAEEPAPPEAPCCSVCSPGHVYADGLCKRHGLALPALPDAIEPPGAPEVVPGLGRLSLAPDGSVYRCVFAPGCPCLACRDEAKTVPSYTWGAS